MSIANLYETICNSKIRKNELLNIIANYHAQKRVSAAEQADVHSTVYARKNEIREFFKALYDENEEKYLELDYVDYTELPEFDVELNKILAYEQEEIARLTAWEVELDAQITTADTELKEIEAYLQSYQQMLTSNISEDFKYGGNN